MTFLSVLRFLLYKSFTPLELFQDIFETTQKGIISVISDLIFLPFVYRKAADLYVLILCSAALLKVSAVGVFGGDLGAFI